MQTKGKTRSIPKTVKQNAAEPEHQTTKTEKTKKQE